jgi:nitrile hydratase
MNGAQDLGGMMGFGPVAPEPNEPLFHAEWEKRAFAVTIAAGACGLWNIDVSRHARETLPPAQYLSKSYYDIWISGLAKLVVSTGMASQEEVATGQAMMPPRPVRNVMRQGDVAGALAKGWPCDRPAQAPALFKIGDAVLTKVINPATHTRLPRYARGKRGVIEAVRGVYVFPDSNAHGRGEDARWLYAVRFNGLELWGEEADPTLSVSIDAWEPYLVSA